MWGYSGIEIIESLQLEFLKYILHIKKSTPNCFVYGKTGQYPLYIHVYSRLIKFWHKLNVENVDKMSRSMLKTLQECFDLKLFESNWLIKVKKILDDCGLSFVWLNPKSVKSEWLYTNVNKRLKDMFIQTWMQQCIECNKSCNYHLFKSIFGLEKYLISLPFCYRIAMTKLRIANHKLPIEKGRYNNLPREDRKCNLCNSEKIGDEFHFLLECPLLNEIRTKYISKYYFTKPNLFKYSQLLSSQNTSKVLKLGKFIKEGFCFIK